MGTLGINLSVCLFQTVSSCLFWAFCAIFFYRRFSFQGFGAKFCSKQFAPCFINIPWVLLDWGNLFFSLNNSSCRLPWRQLSAVFILFQQKHETILEYVNLEEAITLRGKWDGMWNNSLHKSRYHQCLGFLLAHLMASWLLLHYLIP